MEVTDTPKFNIGDRDILFVEHNGSQFVPLVGIMHGRFRLQPNKLGGGEMVSKNNGAPLADAAKLGTDERARDDRPGGPRWPTSKRRFAPSSHKRNNFQIAQRASGRFVIPSCVQPTTKQVQWPEGRQSPWSRRGPCAGFRGRANAAALVSSLVIRSGADGERAHQHGRCSIWVGIESGLRGPSLRSG